MFTCELRFVETYAILRRNKSQLKEDLHETESSDPERAEI